jgi:abequosyltransferase
MEKNIGSQKIMRLSICIPTYNFGAFIGETLDSILSQLTDGVEVIVLDGGSTDNTAEVVRQKFAGIPNLFYHRQAERGGIDRDIERVVSMARGEYCWLFSADDIMQPGAIETVLSSIKTGLDIYICEHRLSTMQLKPIKEHPPFNGFPAMTQFDFSQGNDRWRYFESARTSEAFFSYLAGPIFKKSVWDAVDVPESVYGSCWIVAAHLLPAFKKEVRIQYLGKLLMLKREGNDSFSGGNRATRCKIGIENFQNVANPIFGISSREAFHIRRVLQNDVPLLALLAAKYQAYKNHCEQDLLLLQRQVAMHYMDSGLGNNLRKIIFYMLGYKALVMGYHARALINRLRRR